jgi:LysM repeat protein
MHHLRELCCDATVAGLLKEQTMEYRNTLLDVARRTLSRPTEPSLGLLGLFEDANRLAVRLNWLKKDTHRFRKTRTLLIVLLVGLMLACVLPMAQAQSDAISVQESPKGTPGLEEPLHADHQAQIAIKQHTNTYIVQPGDTLWKIAKHFFGEDIDNDALNTIIQANPTLSNSNGLRVGQELYIPPYIVTSDPVAKPPSSNVPSTAPSPYDYTAMQSQIEAMARQQKAMMEQIEQLKATLQKVPDNQSMAETLKQKMKDQVSHLDNAKLKMEDLKNRMADSERWKDLKLHLDELQLTNRIDDFVDSNNVQVWIKKYADKLPHEILPQIQQWTDSQEFKAWQEDMKVWEKSMQTWTKEFARATENKVKDLRSKDLTFEFSPPNMPPMPAMPKMPAMPFHRDTPPDVKVEVVVPTPPGPQSHAVTPPRPLPKLTPLQERHVRIESHVIAPGIKDGPEFNARCIKAMALTFPDDDYDSITLNNPMGDITVIGTDGRQCTAQIEITSKAKDPDTAKALINQVHITSSKEDQTLIITPSVPDNHSEAQVIVTFNLKVPKTWPLSLKTEVGDITLRNIMSQVHCSANVGDICIGSDANPDTLDAQTNVGDICLATAPNLDAMISASSHVGKIHSTQAFTMSPTQMTGARGTLTLGVGKARVNLKVNVGSIYVGPPSDLAKVSQPQSKTQTKTLHITTPN